MLKRILFIVGFFSITFAHANHFLAGQIYWDALGNDTYRVHLELNVEIGSSNSPGTVSIGSTQYTFNLDTAYAIRDVCGTALFIRRHYSGIVNITVPYSGFINLRYSGCCTPTIDNIQGGSIALVIDSHLYPAGRNLNSARVDMESDGPWNTPTYQIPIITPPASSLMFDFTTPAGAGSSVTYLQGYSANYPTGRDILNNSGYHRFTSNPGRYMVGYRLNSLNSDSLITSSVHFNRVINVSGTPAAANPPVVSLTNSSVAWNTTGAVTRSTTVLPGDVVQFRLNAADIGFLPGYVPQSVSFSASFDPTTPGMPAFTPVSPQNSTTYPITNTMQFQWSVPQVIDPGVYRFHTLFHDDSCASIGVTTLIFEIEVSWANVAQYDVEICIGDSIGLSAQTNGSSFGWYPPTALNSDSLQTVYASPSEDIRYYSLVNDTLVASFDVTVGENAKPLIYVNGSSAYVRIDNPRDFSSHYFFYYGAPFSENVKYQNIQNPGVYHVVGKDGACLNVSDSGVYVGTANGNTAYRSIDTLLAYDSFDTLTSSSAYTIHLNFGDPADAYGVRKVMIPGMHPLTSYAYARLQAIDNTGNSYNVNVFEQTDEATTFLLPSHLKFNEAWTKLELIVDSGMYRVPIYRTGGYPYTFNKLTVFGANGRINGSNVTDQFIPMVLFAAPGIGMVENEFGSIELYPQPANDLLHVEGLESEASYAVIDMHGRTLLSGYLGAENSIVTSSLVPGMYVLQVQVSEGTHTYKFMVE